MTRLQQALADVRRALWITRTFCTLCTVPVREGTRSYFVPAPTIPGTNTCTKCGKKRYRGEEPPAS